MLDRECDLGLHPFLLSTLVHAYGLWPWPYDDNLER